MVASKGMSAREDASLVDILRSFAQHSPDRRGFVCLGAENHEVQSLTYGELDRRARSLAQELLMFARPGDRALLVFPNCLSFVVAFFGCLYAGIIAVPTVSPNKRRVRDSALSIVRDCRPKLVLSLGEYTDRIDEQLAAIPGIAPVQCVAVDSKRFDAPTDWFPQEASGDPILFLQYTSGSTSAPKGVMVSNQNIMANLHMMQRAFENHSGSTYVGWAPLFHDMGLIANVLEPFYIGALCVLMTPSAFAQRPWAWLKAISDYGAEISGGPNFAYDLCVERQKRILEEDIDLSCWRLAFNSAEPVRADTMRAFARTFSGIGFRAEAFYPCYGMAESSLLISGGHPTEPPVIRGISREQLSAGEVTETLAPAERIEAVGCGQALEGEAVKIVDPVLGTELEDGSVGEIWVSGPHVAHGYWEKEAATRETFYAELPTVGGERFLRTGDLGFLDDGELYLVGRLKDVIVIRGRNYYPEDIEAIVWRAHWAFARGASAVFAVERGSGQEIVAVQEVARTARKRMHYWKAVMAVRRAVMEEFELTLNDVVLISPGTIPKTSSGKIKRSATREQYLEGNLRPISATVTADKEGRHMEVIRD